MRGVTQRGEPHSRGDSRRSGKLSGRLDKVTASLAWSLFTGERASLPEGIPDVRETREEDEMDEAVRWQLGRSSTVQADLTCGKPEREGWPETNK